MKNIIQRKNVYCLKNKLYKENIPYYVIGYLRLKPLRISNFFLEGRGLIYQYT